jgi:hypothetical protein
LTRHFLARKETELVQLQATIAALRAEVGDERLAAKSSALPTAIEARGHG